jgi:uncharacterized membrane protein
MDVAIGQAASLSPDTTGRPSTGRLESVDLLRGLIMIVMALDHARDFFTDVPYEPTNLARNTSAALFFTRWVTHFCAPVFFLLAGTGARLSALRGRPLGDLSRYLATRGLFLIVAEETVLKVLWTSSWRPLPLIGLVLWMLGWSMIVLAGLVHLPRWAIAAFGGALVLFHNALDGVQAESWGGLAWLWSFLHGGGVFSQLRQPVFVSIYPLVPWVGVMALGYAGADVLRLPTARRDRILLTAGLAMCAAFVALRFTNWYGDPDPWRPQQSALFTVLSFLNCEKYPPSLLYLLMTLGPAIAVLPLLERWKGPLSRPVLTFGRVPLFYYFLHLVILHAGALVASALIGKPLPWQPYFAQGPKLAPGFGFSLAVVYAAWILAVAALYPACRWYEGLKRRSDFWLLGYV